MAKELKSRKDIPDQYKWNMQDMFASDEAWEEEAKQLQELAKEIAQYQGRLSESAATLLAFLKKSDELDFHAERVIVYANQKYHEDTAVSKYQGYAAKADSIGVEISSAVAFMSPEILSMDEAVLEQFYKDEPELEHYRRMLDNILRKKEHIRSAEVEAVLAQAGDMAAAPSNIYSMFNNADLKFPSVTDVEGNRIQITHGNYISLIENKDRNLRKEVFRGLYGEYKKHANSVTSMFTSHLKQESFYAKVRNYPSVRAMHLASGNIPESVYDNLIETVHKHLPAMHRYVSLRKKLLGVERLHMYDLYVPVVEETGKEYPYEVAKELVKKAIVPMGEDYVAVASAGMDHDWVDVYENENKRSGAYSWGAYGTHPYVLLNHQDNLDSVFTLAHEMGHAMHSYHSDKKQSITYAGYLIFVAEVASTCNEALLMHYLLENCEDEADRKYLINHQLESFRGTLFRQTMFAEFEKIVHQRIADGESLTKEDICKIYHDLNVMYYGPDMIVDEEIDYEWMRIPHFYTSFYVYQYATGYSAAIAFSKKILEEGKPAVDRYIDYFLSGGSSKDPIDLLKDAGVDMSKPEPVDDALCVFENYLEMLESLV
ncbi:MAG: oligoendopeptidase F [Lachnospiraceae bacterium]|nr:oligoendopeptidase F [Lachnospiraceae bacterium]